MTSSIPSLSPQMILNLEIQHAYAREDFFIGPSNQMVFETVISKWPQWQSHRQIVVGPPGSGKTHLATIWQNLNQGIFLTSNFNLEDFQQDLKKTQKKPAIILDLNDFPGHFSEANLFHLYNLVTEDQGYLLILSRHMPQDWPLILPDLKSRLLSLPVQILNDPDDQVLGAVLRKRFADYQMILPENVFAYVLPRIERSFKAAHDFADKVNVEALAQKKSVNLALAKMCLASF